MRVSERELRDEEEKEEADPQVASDWLRLSGDGRKEIDTEMIQTV